MGQLQLGLGGVADELEVIQEEELVAQEAVFEGDPLARAHRADELLEEALRRQVADDRVRAAAAPSVADGLEEVRLAEADAAVEEERVAAPRRAGGDAHGGAADELVGGAA